MELRAMIATKDAVPTRPFRIPTLILVLAMFPGAAVGEARSQGTYDAKGQADEWLVAPDDGRPGCRIRLKTEKTIGGMVAVPAPNCATRIPILASAAAWRATGGITLADATRQPILVFTEDETAILKTRQGGSPAYYMIRPKAGVDRVPHASAVFGTWQMRRPGGSPICAITFNDRPPKAGEESYGLTLDPGCEASIKRLKLVSWRIEDVSLMLYGSDGEALGFQQASSGFEKVARRGDRPLQLVRQP